jgi:hypothetical protein
MTTLRERMDGGIAYRETDQGRCRCCAKPIIDGETAVGGRGAVCCCAPPPDCALCGECARHCGCEDTSKGT